MPDSDKRRPLRTSANEEFSGLRSEAGTFVPSVWSQLSRAIEPPARGRHGQQNALAPSEDDPMLDQVEDVALEEATAPTRTHAGGTSEPTGTP